MRKKECAHCWGQGANRTAGDECKDGRGTGREMDGRKEGGRVGLNERTNEWMDAKCKMQ